MRRGERFERARRAVRVSWECDELREVSGARLLPATSVIPARAGIQTRERCVSFANLSVSGFLLTQE